MGRGFLSAVGLSIVIFSTVSSAWASIDARVFEAMDLEFNGVPPAKGRVGKPLWTALELYQRKEDVLAHFGAPPEIDYDSRWQDLIQVRPFSQSSQGITDLLKYLDPEAQFGRFFEVGTLPSLLRAYRDRDSRSVSDYDVPFLPATLAQPPAFLEGIQKAAAQKGSAKPLQGLRIALDPGHMGSKKWDQLSGKYIVDIKSGKRLSEGEIALQTALLLEAELTRLGAQVFVTRRGMHAVTPLPYDQLDVDEFAVRYLRENSLTSWFTDLIQTQNKGAPLYASFKNSSNFKALFTDYAKSVYYLLGADLQARAEIIEAFDPHITLVLHYDVATSSSADHGLSAGGRNGTKAYVVGSFEEEEFASAEDRFFFVKHLMEPEAWNESVKLSQAMVDTLQTQLAIPFDKSGGSAKQTISPGVFSRNLVLCRNLTGHALSYLEILFYNDPKEFAELTKSNYTMTIDGKAYPYSQRLVDVSNALRDGVLAYVGKHFLN
ncbi:N-acetylmuramoyl-L-alanine amidase [bacterium]|jgi:N-acetylmuramoyl-L-alanine amidase|nr:N-acetylmuramoyl-L-alanine amidase [bacterium]